MVRNSHLYGVSHHTVNVFIDQRSNDALDVWKEMMNECGDLASFSMRTIKILS